MPTATLVLPATPEHARTARLVAGSAARRAGVYPDVLDDVRLAVAEAVALAALRAGSIDHQGDVEVAMTDTGRVFEIAVTDSIPAHLAAADEELALLVMQALADDSRVSQNEGGGQTVLLRWPTRATV